jgi:hypothetical protein
LVGNDAGLWEAVHASLDFNVHMSIVDKRHEIVCLNDFLWYDVDGEAHVFVATHGCAQVEVFYVAAHVFGIGC